MLRILTIILSVILFFQVLNTVSYSQCQRMYTNDSGLSNNIEGVRPTNMIQKGQDYDLSLMKNIKMRNIDDKNLFLYFTVILLMFFSIFAPSSKFFMYGVATYGAPAIIYMLAYKDLVIKNPLYIIILSFLIFMWGASFKFLLCLNKKNSIFLLSLLILLIPAYIIINLFPKLQIIALAKNLNQLILSNNHMGLKVLAYYFFSGLLIIPCLHAVFINFILKENVTDETHDHIFPPLFFKALLFLVWLTITFLARPIAAYLFTIFILGSVFREKKIVGNPMIFISNKGPMILFIYILSGTYILLDKSTRHLIFLELDKFIVIIMIIFFSFFIMITVLKKIFKKKINILYMTSFHPLFMISFSMWPKYQINNQMMSIFYISSLIILVVGSFMI